MLKGTDYARFADTILEQGWVKPNKRIFNDAKVSDHFAIIPTTEAPKRLNDIEQRIYDLVARRFLAIFYPPAEFLETTRITRVENEPFKTTGKVMVKAGWLEVHGRDKQGDETLAPLRAEAVEGTGTSVTAQAAEDTPAPVDDAGARTDHERRHRRNPGCRGQAERNPAARAVHRGHAAGRHGRRRQARNRRGPAGGHGGQGARHLRDPGVDHRGAPGRGLSHPGRQGAARHFQGLHAYGAAERPRRPGAHQAGAHRQLGVPALPDAGRQEEPRRVHGRDRGDDPADRGPGAAVRARHHPRRLRLPLGAVPQVQGRVARALPELPVRELRRQPAQDPGRTAAERRGDREAHRRRPDRAAAGIPQPPGKTVRSRAEAVSRVPHRLRLRQRIPERRRRDRTRRGLHRPGTPGTVPPVRRARVRAAHALRVRERRGRGTDMRVQLRQDHPPAGGGAGADGQAAEGGQERPPAGLRFLAHRAAVQGVPGLAGRQGGLRIRTSRSAEDSRARPRQAGGEGGLLGSGTAREMPAVRRPGVRVGLAVRVREVPGRERSRAASRPAR